MHRFQTQIQIQLAGLWDADQYGGEVRGRWDCARERLLSTRPTLKLLDVHLQQMLLLWMYHSG